MATGQAVRSAADSARHRSHRAFAAAGHPGESNRNPASRSRPGTTRCVFITSSLSVRSRNVPSSTIQAVADPSPETGADEPQQHVEHAAADDDAERRHQPMSIHFKVPG